MNRRHFLQASAALAALAPLNLRAAEKPARAHRKAFMYSTLNSPTAKTLSVLEKFKLLREAKFAGVEVMSAMNQAEVLAARDATDLAIPSVIIATHWTHPLTSPNPTMRETGLNGLKQGLRDAKAYGASSVLLVPGIVNKDISYADAHTRATAEIAKAVPLAEELGVAIAIENVWNKFLLSPLEAVAFVDSFKSKAVRWHFDVGNVVDMGWPDQWVRTLGSRIAKIHVKEFSRKLRDEKGPYAGFRVDLLAGDSDWPAVMKALDAVAYSGWLIAEQYRIPDLTDAEWLSHLSTKMDQIIAS
ncbi:MAG: sugar phosphate isomerase/epimerase [Opitutus sp.]|nr:sugar phosphate isomerase/epimerase [Opitutus sp.]